MKLIDSNVWLALALSGHSHHERVVRWLEGQVRGEQLAFCRMTQSSLLRLLTTASLMRGYGVPPLSNEESWRVVDGFLNDSRVTFVQEPAQVEPIWRSLSAVETASPKAWMDSYLAAFAKAGDYELVTTDKAFVKVKDLKTLIIT